MGEVRVKVVCLPHFEGLALPAYETAGSAGLDLRAALATDLKIGAGMREIVPTGLCLAIPQGYELQVRPRSGLAAKHGISLVNSPGTIDSDYRGEVKIILINHGMSDFIICPGDRIAQAVLAPVTRLVWENVHTLDETERGAQGFGSTGV